MEQAAEQFDVPRVSIEQGSLDRLVKQVRKLRWIGRAEDAEQVKSVLIRFASNGKIDAEQKTPSRSDPSCRSAYEAQGGLPFISSEKFHPRIPQVTCPECGEHMRLTQIEPCSDKRRFADTSTFTCQCGFVYQHTIERSK